MDDNNRFSILILEKDVLEYNHYRQKFNEFDSKTRSKWYIFNKSLIQDKKMYWYKKYIGKMKYIEDNYRKTNIYTEYHAKLEQLDTEPVIATVIEPSCPPFNINI
jgi:hypothetical protein